MSVQVYGKPSGVQALAKRPNRAGKRVMLSVEGPNVIGLQIRVVVEDLSLGRAARRGYRVEWRMSLILRNRRFGFSERR